MHDLAHGFVKSLYVMRHGHSEANARRLIVSSLEQGATGYGLTEQGCVQVTQQVQAWKAQNEFGAIGEIICSPFLRAQETAAIASNLLQWPSVTQEPALRERFFGDLDLQDDSHYAQVWKKDELDPTHVEGHVESVSKVRDRVLAFLTVLARAHHGQPILIVTHGDTASILLTLLRQGDLKHHRNLGSLTTAQIQSCFVG